MEKSLQINIYGRSGRLASVVFKRNDIPFRITTVLEPFTIISELYRYKKDLKEGSTPDAFYTEIIGPRNKRWMLEILHANGVYSMQVFALQKGIDDSSHISMKFSWKGDKSELLIALNTFEAKVSLSSSLRSASGRSN